MNLASNILAHNTRCFKNSILYTLKTFLASYSWSIVETTVHQCDVSREDHDFDKSFCFRSDNKSKFFVANLTLLMELAWSNIHDTISNYRLFYFSSFLWKYFFFVRLLCCWCLLILPDWDGIKVLDSPDILALTLARTISSQANKTQN